MSGPVQAAIVRKMQGFDPTHLEILNESAHHNVAPGSETHFKVIVVSHQFEAMPLLSRHRAVNNSLAEELKGGVHALSIVAKTPEQWAKSTSVAASPPCMGGSRM
jgi:stress-induced morphogen